MPYRRSMPNGCDLPALATMSGDPEYEFGVVVLAHACGDATPMPEIAPRRVSLIWIKRSRQGRLRPPCLRSTIASPTRDRLIASGDATLEVFEAVGNDGPLPLPAECRLQSAKERRRGRPRSSRSTSTGARGLPDERCRGRARGKPRRRGRRPTSRPTTRCRFPRAKAPARS